MSIMPVGGWKSVKPIEGEVVPNATPYVRPGIQQPPPKQESSFTKGFGVCLGVLCAIVVFGFLINLMNGVNEGLDKAWNSTQSADSENSRNATATIVRVSAPVLNEAYEANEAAADSEYAGKTLEVTGTVTGINKNAFDNTYITMNDSSMYNYGTLTGVSATLNDDAATNDIALALQRGESVTVRCTKVQRIIGSVMLSNCGFMATTQSDTESPSTSGSNEPQQMYGPATTSAVQSNTTTNAADYTQQATTLFNAMTPEERAHPGDGEGVNAIAPRILYSESPIYPTAAVAAHISGVVKIRATIETDGTATDVHIVESASPILDEAALAAFRTYRFAPARNSITNAPTVSKVEQELIFPASNVRQQPPAPIERQPPTSETY